MAQQPRPERPIKAKEEKEEQEERSLPVLPVRDTVLFPACGAASHGWA